MKRTMLLLLAILGTILGYMSLNLFIVTVSFMQYIGIEIVLSLLHWMYNRAKQDLINKPI
jgi:hypothetical protein